MQLPSQFSWFLSLFRFCQLFPSCSNFSAFSQLFFKFPKFDWNLTIFDVIFHVSWHIYEISINIHHLLRLCSQICSIWLYRKAPESPKVRQNISAIRKIASLLAEFGHKRLNFYVPAVLVDGSCFLSLFGKIKVASLTTQLETSEKCH